MEFETPAENDNLKFDASSNTDSAADAILGSNSQWEPTISDVTDSSLPFWSAKLTSDRVISFNCRIVSVDFTVSKVQQVKVEVVYEQDPGMEVLIETVWVHKYIPYN